MTARGLKTGITIIGKSNSESRNYNAAMMELCYYNNNKSENNQLENTTQCTMIASIQQ